MQRWEYLVLKDWPTADELNDLGFEGWELVAAVAAGLEENAGNDYHPAMDAYKVRLYFKRPV